MAGMNLDLLAGLVQQMNRMTELVRLRKILFKKPQNRTKTDLKHLLKESANMTLLGRRGEAVHLDMCHALELQMVSEGDMLAFHDLVGKGECYILVMSGRLWVETADIAPFKCKGDSTGGTDTSGPKEASDGELLSLFASIDADGSGAIDVEEFQYALEMMGVQMSVDKVQELMDSVDEDKSGEIEFPEFKMIMQEKLGLGKVSTSNWEPKHGKQSRYLGEGAVIGEESINGSVGPMTGKIMVLEDADLCLMSRANYHNILENGFGGDLARKVELLMKHSVVQKCIKRSDLKRIAHACSLHTLSAKEVLSGQGVKPENLIFLCEGTCKMQEKREVEGSSNPRTPRTVKDLRKAGAAVHRSRAGVHTQMVDIAILQAGDLAGIHVLIDTEGEQVPKHTIVSVPTTVVLKMKKKDLTTLLHPTDLEALKTEVLEIAERREKSSVTSLKTAKSLRRRSKTMRQFVSALDKVKTAHPETSAELLEAEDHDKLLTMIVDSGAEMKLGLRQGSTITSMLSDMKAISDSGIDMPKSRGGHLDGLSTNPRKLTEQLRSAESLNVGQSNMNKNWDQLSKSMNALAKMKKFQEGRAASINFTAKKEAKATPSLDEMISSVQAGHVSLDALLSALGRMQAQSTDADIESLFQVASAGQRRGADEPITIWSGSQRVALPPPPPTAAHPRQGGAGGAVRHSKDLSAAGKERLAKLLTPRDKAVVEHIQNVEVDLSEPNGGRSSQVVSACLLTTEVLAGSNSNPVHLPWKKEKPVMRTSAQRQNLFDSDGKEEGGDGKPNHTVEKLNQLNQVLTKTIDKGLSKSIQRRAGITVGHIKKLKQTISVIMWLTSKSSSRKRREEKEAVEKAAAEGRSADTSQEKMAKV
eukprot:CAMPEP_0117675716 /NCGR_PEP_ID=MMETSP0804-20121206/15763_1 /TAXON_ID=1074897 /ORGANISM="Tetraselmis astigmatica, Strain CCMP880" /LENGTH=870 /DNA_ID=CAMNT_0005484757 /DNA_START=693 /DNA_END=3302 /DNA_ORIENTATION=+